MTLAPTPTAESLDAAPDEDLPEITLEETGWECEPTIDALLGALTQALSTDDLERRQRGQNGRRLVRARFAWPAIVQQLLEACTQHC